MSSRIKECFTSRFGENGRIVNFDYKQLEVVALAVLSGDPVLKADLLSGIDIHKEYAIKVFGKCDDVLRTYIKRLTFMLQYGATEYGMSMKLGLPKATCHKFIKEYFLRYRGVAEYHKRLQEEVIKNAFPCKEISTTFPLKRSQVQSITGRLYSYDQEVRMVKDWKTGLTSPVANFKPTTIKNYPVQGIATGDLVPLMTGLLNRYLIKLDRNLRSDVKLVNSVHDSIMLDVKVTVLNRAFLWGVRDLLESAPEQMKTFYGVDWNMPTPVDCEIGKSWATLDKVNL